MDGKYLPNQRIILSRVAEEFESSEIPVREAIKHLTADGYVVQKPYVGAVVVDIGFEDIMKIYEVRIILEEKAVKLAVKNITPKIVDQLEHKVKSIEKDIKDKDFKSAGDHYKKFYQLFYEPCGNEYLCKTIFGLWDLTYRRPGMLAVNLKRTKTSLEGLKSIIRAIKKSDIKLIEKLMKKQKANAIDGWKQLYKI